MIAAQELRLNNHVNTEYGIGRVTSLELHTPSGFEIGVTVPPLEKYVYKNPKVEGVFLSATVLDSIFDRYYNTEYKVKWDGDKYGMPFIVVCLEVMEDNLFLEYYGMRICIECLHQLQNLVFALCGKELDIKFQ